MYGGEVIYKPCLPMEEGKTEKGDRLLTNLLYQTDMHKTQLTCTTTTPLLQIYYKKN